MNLNLDYWITRYNTKDSKNVVGHKSWNNEQYKEQTQLFFDNIEHFLPANRQHNILDFGCGICRFLPLLERHFDNYYGVDIIDTVIKKNIQDYPQHHFQQILGNGYFNLGYTKFDMIFTCVTLQHVIDDQLLKKYIKHFRNIINRDGYVLFTENIAPKKALNYLKFRTPDEYIQLCSPEFKLKKVSSFISYGEEHTVFKGEPT